MRISILNRPLFNSFLGVMDIKQGLFLRLSLLPSFSLPAFLRRSSISELTFTSLPLPFLLQVRCSSFSSEYVLFLPVVLAPNLEKRTLSRSLLTPLLASSPPFVSAVEQGRWSVWITGIVISWRNRWTDQLLHLLGSQSGSVRLWVEGSQRCEFNRDEEEKERGRSSQLWLLS